MQTNLLRRVERLLAILPPHRRLLAVQFIQFGVIGALGFCWYTATMYAAAPRIGPYAAGVLAYVVAASMNWLMNRLWTFRHLEHGAMHLQWLSFLAANALGASLNLGTSFTLIATVPFCRSHLVIPLMAGTLAGMFFNFAASRRLVFR
jgi:putative flippase GtrA